MAEGIKKTDSKERIVGYKLKRRQSLFQSSPLPLSLSSSFKPTVKILVERQSKLWSEMDDQQSLHPLFLEAPSEAVLGEKEVGSWGWACLPFPMLLHPNVQASLPTAVPAGEAS